MLQRIGLLGGLCITTATASADIVINEVLYDPPPDDPLTPLVVEGDANQDGIRDGSDDEFLELVNTGLVAEDLTGWSITVTNSVGTPIERHIFPSGSTVDPDGKICVSFFFTLKTHYVRENR